MQMDDLLYGEDDSSAHSYHIQGRVSRFDGVALAAYLSRSARLALIAQSAIRILIAS